MMHGDVIRFEFSFFDTMSTRDDRMRTGVAGRRLPKGVTPVGTAFEGLFRGATSTVAGGKVVNQDVCAHCDTPLGLVAMVCDGMGKGKYGHQASLDRKSVV